MLQFSLRWGSPYLAPKAIQLVLRLYQISSKLVQSKVLRLEWPAIIQPSSFCLPILPIISTCTDKMSQNLISSFLRRRWVTALRLTWALPSSPILLQSALNFNSETNSKWPGFEKIVPVIVVLPWDQRMEIHVGQWRICAFPPRWSSI